MTQYLLFTLAAPLASFGTVAVGERRASESRPTKSQVVGLIAAALGIERTEEARLAALTASLGYAVRVEDPGVLAVDYHTAQVPPVTRKRRYAARAAELAVPRHEQKTVLSRREFRTGVFATVVVWLRTAGPAKLDDVAGALARPACPLAAGRKSFPLMLPCRPQIVEAATIVEALKAHDDDEPPAVASLRNDFALSPRRAAEPVLYADADAAIGTTAGRRTQVRDLPESRAKWRFGIREEVVASLGGGTRG